MQPLVDLGKASVFYDGLLTEPQLDHPEGLAFDETGALWCSGERGQTFRIDPDGTKLTQVASTGGFTLGMAIDGRGHLFVCDLKHAALYRLEIASARLEVFARGGMRIPNYPVVDRRRNCIYVSDSHQFGRPGPGVWRFGLSDGSGELWYGGDLDFANGMALSADGRWLYVVESFARRIRRIPIGPDGSAGEADVFAENVGRVPDGLAFDVEGNLYVSCYEPSAVYRISPRREVSLLIEDPEAHTFCHPTNCAFRGSDLFTANLGRWHITRFPAGIEGVNLPV